MPQATSSDLRQQIITHIMKMKTLDQDYAREALAFYNNLLPWLMLNDGVREAMRGGK